MALKESYGFLNKHWNPGDISDNTADIPRGNKMTGKLFIEHKEGMQLEQALIATGKINKHAIVKKNKR